MEHLLKKTSLANQEKDRKFSAFLFLNIALFILMPLLSVSAEIIFEHESLSWMLIGKWFVFWATGIRLFSAGISQTSNPAFTAGIFKMSTRESYTIIRELGFANISLGVMGILSVLNEQWRMLAAISGSLFFGLAGIQHLFKKPGSVNEIIAMIGDLFVMVVLLLYLFMTIFNH